jgi:hypothetical protein
MENMHCDCSLIESIGDIVRIAPNEVVFFSAQALTGTWLKSSYVSKTQDWPTFEIFVRYCHERYQGTADIHQDRTLLCLW